MYIDYYSLLVCCITIRYCSIIKYYNYYEYHNGLIALYVRLLVNNLWTNTVRNGKPLSRFKG